MDFRNGVLTNVDVFFKIVTLQCSWVRRNFDKCFDQENHAVLFFIQKALGKSFKVDSNLDFNNDIVKFFPQFYKSKFLT